MEPPLAAGEPPFTGEGEQSARTRRIFPSMEARLNAPRPLPTAPLIVGSFFALLGILLTIDNLDVIETSWIVRYWPVVLIAVGAAKLMEEQGNRVVAFILLLVGAGLLGDNLGLVRFSLFDLWPIILILVGAAFVARSFGVDPSARVAERMRRGNLAVFAERTIDETSSDYRGGSATALLGTLRVDLTRADITTAPAVIDAYAFWGSVEILVPDQWEVIGEVAPFMAGFEVRTHGPKDPKRRLIVRGAAMMASIEVKSVSGRKS